MNIQNNKKVDDILNSLDSVKRASAPDFFYTRLKARMEKRLEPVAQRPWILRPVFAFAALVIVVLINAAVIFQGQNSTETNGSDTDTYQSIAAEYNLNDSMLEEVYK
jgi:hypothetical protein